MVVFWPQSFVSCGGIPQITTFTTWRAPKQQPAVYIPLCMACGEKQMSGSKSGKWKDALLKTSLPIEQIVAEKVSAKKFYVAGEYRYIRPNEHNIQTEFSADLWAFEVFRREEEVGATLNLMFECKYNYPGVSWIFSEHPNQEDVDAGVISVFQDATGLRLADSPLYRLDDKLRFCVKGIELHQDDANPQSVTRALNQLRFAAAQFAVEQIERQLMARHDSELEAELLCSIIVTTADLRILKPGIGLGAFQNANDLTDISDEASALIVYQQLGPQLTRYARRLWRDATKKLYRYEERLQDLRAVITSVEPDRWPLPTDFVLQDSVSSAAKRVLVVRLDALDSILNQLRRGVHDSLRASKKLARLEYDAQHHVSDFVRAN